jgi:nicotinate-nucleotide adenylyltransferase
MMKDASRIGLLGGTFDPLHNGHLAVARAVRDQLGLDRVLLIPASRPPHKLHYPITPFATRAAMIQAALADEPALALSLIEEEANGPSFSIDTLERLSARLGPRQFYFIIGSDAFADIASWKRFRDLPCLTNLAVVNRGDTRPDEQQAIIRRHFPEFALAGEGRWQAAGRGEILLLTMPPVEVSSTMVRDLVRRGADISGLVPEAVAAAIDRHVLYGISEGAR